MHKVWRCPVKWHHSRVLKERFLRAIHFWHTYFFLVNHNSIRWSFSQLVLPKRKGYRLHIVNGKSRRIYTSPDFLLFLFIKGDCLWVFILLVIYSFFILRTSAVTYNHALLRLADEKIKENKCRLWFSAGQLLFLLKTGRILAYFTKSNSDMY